MRARRSLIVLLTAGLLVACNAALTVLESGPPDDGGVTEGGPETGAPPEGGSDGPNDAGDGGDAGDGWPGPPGTVVPIASGLVGAVDIDVDDTYVYVLVGVQDGGLWRVPKRGGAPDPVALHQTYPTAVRVTPEAVVWTVAPGVSPLAASVMLAPRDGGAPTPLLVGGDNAGQLAADGHRVVWVDHGGGEGRVMVAELDKGSIRPITNNQLAVGGFAIEGDRVVWSARCSANLCGGFVMSSPLAVPAAAPVWSTTSNSSMRGIGLSAGTIGFAYASGAPRFFSRLPPGATVPIAYPGSADVVSALRRDGDSFTFLTKSASSVVLTRTRADGSGPLVTLSSSPGTDGATVPDGPAIYWISKEEGILRAIAR